MNKNNSIKHILLSKTNIALICALGMLTGFLLSRAWLSFFTFAFGVNALWNIHPRLWFKQKWWMIGFAWVAMYGISYFWSNDIPAWSSRFEVKAPILLLPLAFAMLPAFSAKQLRIFTFAAAIIFLGSVAYSLQFYLQDPVYYAEQYVYSHVLPTLADGDHIRYSLSLALFVVWCVGSWGMLDAKWQKWFVAITVAVISVYLHILAARTGLVIWYLFIFSWAIRFAIKKKPLVGVGVLIVLFSGAIIAVNYIPTLEKRVWYFKHTYELYKSGNLQSEYSDMGRLISYRIAGEKIAQHPLLGVGSGDILHEMKDGYQAKFANVEDENRLLPHNQFFIVMLSCGIAALVLFIIWVIMPLSWLTESRHTFYLFITWLSLVLALLVEPMLEVQFGVFVFLFFLLWQKHALRTQAT